MNYVRPTQQKMALLLRPYGHINYYSHTLLEHRDVSARAVRLQRAERIHVPGSWWYAVSIFCCADLWSCEPRVRAAIVYSMSPSMYSTVHLCGRGSIHIRACVAMSHSMVAIWGPSFIWRALVCACACGAPVNRAHSCFAFSMHTSFACPLRLRSRIVLSPR